jgi:hypothetical protein
MKATLAVAFGFLLAAWGPAGGVIVGAQSSAAPKPYKVVFDLTTDDRDQTAVLRWRARLRQPARVGDGGRHVRARPRARDARPIYAH